MALPALLLGGSVASFLATVSRYLTFYIIARIAFSLGVVAFSIVGSNYLIDYIETAATTYMSTTSASISSILLMSGVASGIAIIFNCWVIALNISQVKGVFKGFKIG